MEFWKKSPEPGVKEQLPRGGIVRKEMEGKSWQALGVGHTGHNKALPQRSLRPQMQYWVSTIRSPHFPLSSPIKVNRYGRIFDGGGLGPNHIGPRSQVPATHWFPLGDGLPDQGQASDTNELCNPLYTFDTIFWVCLQFTTHVI